MALRVYVVPMVETTKPNGETQRRVKYEDSHLSDVDRTLMPFGDELLTIVVADVGAEHAAFAAETDVLALPADLDQQIGAQLTTVQNALESRNIPAGWVQTTHTYRQVIRIVCQVFQFMQRLQGRRSGSLFAGGVTLDTRFNQLPVAVRTALQQAAQDAGFDTSSLSGASTIRQILKAMADQWHQIESFFGDVAV